MDYIEAFEEIIDGMRDVGTITNISATSLISTITSDNTLKVGEWVLIDSVEYRIKSVTSTEFTVDGIGITGTEWKALAPYFMYDTPLKMVNRLTMKDDNEVLKYQKYQLIYLRLNNKELDKGNGYYPIFDNLTFDLMTPTKLSYFGEERKAISFDPILHPLRDEFIEAINDYGYIKESGSQLIRTTEDNYLLGTPDSKNILNDIVDITTIVFDTISFIRQCD